MSLPLFPLMAYLVSATYLVGWVFRIIRNFCLVGWARWRWRRIARKVTFLKMWNTVGDGQYLWIILSGILFGMVAAFWLSRIFISEWLLVIFVILSMLAEEFRVFPKETRLLDVLIFFDCLLAQCQAGVDLFESMATIIPDLPAGEVQRGIREAVLNRRSGIEIEKSFRTLRRLDTFLDEFLLALKLTGWQNRPALIVILNILLRRTVRQWGRTSRVLMMKDRAKPYLLFVRTALITGLWLLLLHGSIVLAFAWPDPYTLAILGLLLLGSGILFELSIDRSCLRRCLAIFIFLIALGTYTHLISFKFPSNTFELQVMNLCCQ